MIWLLALLACNRGPEVTDLPNAPGGNPLVPEVALLPFPSDLYLAEDAETPTGRRLAYPEEALPEGLPPSMFDADGFSRITPIVTLVPGGVDPSTLPDPADPGATLGDASVLLVRADDAEKWPVLAELDAGATDPEETALLLRPHRALDPSTTYVVLLTDALRTADGGVPEPGRAFVALRDGLSTDHETVEAMREDFEVVNATIAALGLEPESIVLGWSFTTRSREQIVTPLHAMHERMAEVDGSDWTVTSETDDGENRLVEGTFTVPDFLGPDGIEVIDGEPVEQGSREVEVLLTVPATVTEARPVVLFGHGFFSSREETTWSSLNSLLHAWQMPAVSADFIGFNESDQVETLTVLGGDLKGLGWIVDQQLQSQAQFTALVRLIENALATDPAVDADRIAYHGISNGGTQGLSILAASPLIDRAALVVPGGGWSHMMQRAVQWNTLGILLENRYPDPVELQVVLALTQTVFDPVDSLHHADRLVHDRPDGRDVEVSLHMAVGDAQVANLVTEWVARTAQIPLVTPSPVDVWGLDTIEAPEETGADGSAALLVYDEGYAPLPEGNVPPSSDNGAHETIRKLDVYREQVGTFLETGRIVQVCDGACDPD